MSAPGRRRGQQLDPRAARGHVVDHERSVRPDRGRHRPRSPPPPARGCCSADPPARERPAVAVRRAPLDARTLEQHDPDRRRLLLGVHLDDHRLGRRIGRVARHDAHPARRHAADLERPARPGLVHEVPRLHLQVPLRDHGGPGDALAVRVHDGAPDDAAAPRAGGCRPRSSGPRRPARPRSTPRPCPRPGPAPRSVRRRGRAARSDPRPPRRMPNAPPAEAGLGLVRPLGLEGRVLGRLARRVHHPARDLASRLHHEVHGIPARRGRGGRRGVPGQRGGERVGPRPRAPRRRTLRRPRSWPRPGCARPGAAGAPAPRPPRARCPRGRAPGRGWRGRSRGRRRRGPPPRAWSWSPRLSASRDAARRRRSRARRAGRGPRANVPSAFASAAIRSLAEDASRCSSIVSRRRRPARGRPSASTMRPVTKPPSERRISTLASVSGSTTTAAIPGARPPSRATTVYSPGRTPGIRNSPRASVRSVGRGDPGPVPFGPHRRALHRTTLVVPHGPGESRAREEEDLHASRPAGLPVPAWSNPGARATRLAGVRPIPSRRKRPFGVRRGLVAGRFVLPAAGHGNARAHGHPGAGHRPAPSPLAHDARDRAALLEPHRERARGDPPAATAGRSRARARSRSTAPAAATRASPFPPRRSASSGPSPSRARRRGGRLPGPAAPSRRRRSRASRRGR